MLTGETGAGKSIIIDSINAVTGKRTSKDLIRSGRDRATVSALFTGLNPAALSACAEHGVEAEGGELLLRREMHADGRNICHANGQPVTLAALRGIADSLIDIHGQRDNTRLLDPARHLDFLDAYAGNGGERERYLAAFEKYRDIKRRLSSLYSARDEGNRRREELRETVNELGAAKIVPGEPEKLRERRKRAENAERLRSALNGAVAALTGDDDSPGAAETLSSLAGDLRGVEDAWSGAGEVSAKLEDYALELRALSETLERAAEDADFSPGELEKIEERLDMYSRLSRKYGDEEACLAALESATEELSRLDNYSGEVASLEKESHAAGEELIAAGDELTATRQAAGKRFSAAVSEILRELGMPEVRFSVSRETGPYTRHGKDRVEFLISANAGEAARPLAKIASGGEMSRVMLAVKSVLLSADTVDTLIFDEIDTGLGGNAALKVGRRMKILSGSKQLLCITHLAGIAAMASRHLLVEKAERDGRTYTSVTALEGDARVEEIARMLAGGEMTEHLRRTAADLIESGMTDDGI